MKKLIILSNIAWFAITVLFIVVFLAVGVYLIVANSGFLKEFSADSALNTIWARIIGIVMVALWVEYFIALYLKTRKEDCIAFDNPDGEVIISVSAVEDSIRRLVETFEDVKSVSPSVSAVNDGVDVEIKVSLWDDSNVHSTSEKLQSATKSHLQSYFGLANVNSVKVFVSGTSNRGSAPATPPPKHEDHHDDVGSGDLEKIS